MKSSLFVCSVRITVVNRVVFFCNTISHDAIGFKLILVYESISFARFIDSSAGFARQAATPETRVSPRSGDVWGGE